MYTKWRDDYKKYELDCGEYGPVKPKCCNPYDDDWDDEDYWLAEQEERNLQMRLDMEADAREAMGGV